MKDLDESVELNETQRRQIEVFKLTVSDKDCTIDS
jgi:hypothetical protein